MGHQPKNEDPTITRTWIRLVKKTCSDRLVTVATNLSAAKATASGLVGCVNLFSLI